MHILLATTIVASVTQTFSKHCVILLTLFIPYCNINPEAGFVVETTVIEPASSTL